MSKIFGAVRFDFGIFRWIFVHFFVSFHFIRFDLYCYKITPRSFQLPAYLWCTLLDLERIGGGGEKTKSSRTVQSGHRDTYIFYLTIFIMHSNKSCDWISSTCNSHMNAVFGCAFFFILLASLSMLCIHMSLFRMLLSRSLSHNSLHIL